MTRWMIALALVALPAAAQAMTVEQFLAKTDALKKKGILALASPDIGVLKAEVTTIGTDYRRDILAARAAGKPPHSCPPPKGSGGARMTSGEFIAEMERIPPAQRARTSVKAAFYAMMKRRYPCPA